MYAQGINMNPWGRPAVQPFSADPPQFAPPKFTSPAEGMTAQTPIAVQYHICVSCKKPRSRKYQREHPLKPGESPAVAFCRKCQKDATSTEQSDDTEAYSRKKKHEDKKKRQNKDVVSLVSHLSLKSWLLRLYHISLTLCSLKSESRDRADSSRVGHNLIYVCKSSYWRTKSQPIMTGREAIISWLRKVLKNGGHVATPLFGLTFIMILTEINKCLSPRS
jgi:hypothetical protein